MQLACTVSMSKYKWQRTLKMIKLDSFFGAKIFVSGHPENINNAKMHDSSLLSIEHCIILDP